MSTSCAGGGCVGVPAHEGAGSGAVEREAPLPPSRQAAAFGAALAFGLALALALGAGAALLLSVC
jgi:hypothetical protein